MYRKVQFMILRNIKIKKPKPSLFLRATRTAVAEKWKCDYSLMTPTRFHSAHASKAKLATTSVASGSPFAAAVKRGGVKNKNYK